MTAAHSTLVVGDRSSCRFAFHAGLRNWLDDEIISGPDRVDVERGEGASGASLVIEHNGYEPRFGLHPSAPHRPAPRRQAPRRGGPHARRRGMRWRSVRSRCAFTCIRTCG